MGEKGLGEAFVSLKVEWKLVLISILSLFYNFAVFFAAYFLIDKSDLISHAISVFWFLIWVPFVFNLLFGFFIFGYLEDETSPYIISITGLGTLFVCSLFMASFKVMVWYPWIMVAVLSLLILRFIIRRRFSQTGIISSWKVYGVWFINAAIMIMVIHQFIPLSF